MNNEFKAVLKSIEKLTSEIKNLSKEIDSLKDEFIKLRKSIAHKPGEVYDVRFYSFEDPPVWKSRTVPRRPMGAGRKRALMRVSFFGKREK